jgi:branched-chain amino acid transport system ATP-binding protein
VTSVLRVQGLTKRFGGLTAVDDVSLSVEARGITGLIGPNGAGKTTLFSLISGFERPSLGHIFLRGEEVTELSPHRRAGLGIARTFQIVQPFARLSVAENIAVGAHLRHRSRAEATLKARDIAARLGLAPMLDKPAASLTVAGRKRLELARALATEPVLLLLDEVLAGLNPSEMRDIIPLIRTIRDNGVTVIMVEHVMQAVMNLCERVIVLNQGRMIADGSPREVTRDQRVVEAYLGQGAAARLEAAHG